MSEKKSSETTVLVTLEVEIMIPGGTENTRERERTGATLDAVIRAAGTRNMDERAKVGAIELAVVLVGGAVSVSVGTEGVAWGIVTPGTANALIESAGATDEDVLIAGKGAMKVCPEIASPGPTLDAVEFLAGTIIVSAQAGATDKEFSFAAVGRIVR